jgi:hypothetical protein
MDFLDELAKSAFGRTVAEAHAQNICIFCSTKMNLTALAQKDKDEYGISGLCSLCFDVLQAE